MTDRPRPITRLSALARRLAIGKPPRLFDAAHYLRAYPEVGRSGLDPFLHYVLIGARRGFDPSEDFDTAFYRRQSGKTALDPLRHYLRVGAKAGLDPSRAFSTLMYLTRYPDVGRAGINPLQHYLANGRAEGRLATPSSSEPEQWVALAGVADAHRWDHPSEGRRPFSLSLLRLIPATACGAYAPRLCLVLTLDGAEINGLIHAVENFGAGALDALTLEIDPAARLHPPRPTLILALEHCFHGAGADGARVARYAEIRIWDLLLEKPRLKATFPAGCLSIRAG